jgi:hypothetical protein
MGAASTFTHFSGYHPVPPTNGALSLDDKSPMHNAREAQTSFLDTIVGQHGDFEGKCPGTGELP